MQTETTAANWKVEVFFDGDCPLCRREIDMLRKLDRRNQIRLTNIASPDFVAENYGRTIEDFMSEIHGRMPGDRWIVGVEVFRQLYETAGFGRLVSITRVPLISHALEIGYRLFARYRLRLTGRCDSGTCRTTA